MLTKLRSVRWQAWLLLILTAALGVFSLVSITYKLLPPTATTNIVMPVGAIAIALLAYAFTHGQGDRVRHAGDKAILIGSVLAIWFVAYFATGLLVTYVHNALVSPPFRFESGHPMLDNKNHEKSIKVNGCRALRDRHPAQ